MKECAEQGIKVTEAKMVSEDKTKHLFIEALKGQKKKLMFGKMQGKNQAPQRKDSSKKSFGSQANTAELSFEETRKREFNAMQDILR